MRKASWIVLTVLAALVLALSLVSAWVAYSPNSPDEFGEGGPKLADVAAWNPEVATAIRGRRGTASAYSAAFATLLLFVVLRPYRRGEAWAWWAILGALLVLTAVSSLRVPALGTRLGVGGPITILVIGVVGLLLDARRLKQG
jgi:hypothetical protein